MANVSKVAVSRLIAAGEDSDPKDGQKSRGDYKKLKELEEARCRFHETPFCPKSFYKFLAQ
jgi:hypothetical protein